MSNFHENSIVILNIKSPVTKKMILEECKRKFGPIVMSKVQKMPNGRRMLLVKFSDKISASKAINFHDLSINGVIMYIREAYDLRNFKHNFQDITVKLEISKNNDEISMNSDSEVLSIDLSDNEFKDVEIINDLSFNRSHLINCICSSCIKISINLAKAKLYKCPILMNDIVSLRNRHIISYITMNKFMSNVINTKKLIENEIALLSHYLTFNYLHV